MTEAFSGPHLFPNHCPNMVAYLNLMVVAVFCVTHCRAMIEEEGDVNGQKSSVLFTAVYMDMGGGGKTSK